MKTIIIKVDNKRIDLSPKTFVPINKTNIPFKHLNFKESQSIFWEVEMISFDKTNSELRLKVVDYFSIHSDRIIDQQSKYSISQLRFEPFDWDKLEKLLTSYQKKEIQPMLLDTNYTSNDPHISRIPLQIPLSKLNFGMGYITFRKDFKWRRPETEFKILHPDSIPEFEHIKYYFRKILGKGTIDVVLEVASTYNETKLKSIQCSDIQLINENSIRVLKVQKMDEWTSKKPKLELPDKSLFTFQDAMESYGDEALGNIDLIEKDLLFHLIEKESVRNKMQLRYLSERIQDQKEKLLMTLVPQFGFVFVHKGEEMTHYIWELINTHATYVWSIPASSMSDPIKRIEQEVRTINVHGRQKYKSSFEPDEDLFFHVIHHKASNYSYEQYFSNWKKKLDSLLV